MSNAKEMFSEYKDVLTTMEVVQALHMGRNSVLDLLKKGEIKSIRVGQKYLIPKVFLIDYIEAHR